MAAGYNGFKSTDFSDFSMKTNRYLPDPNRISVLTATVLLAFALTRLLETTTYLVVFQVFGFIIRFDVDLRIIIILLASGLTATGMDWLLKGHPLIEKKKRTLDHWLVPMLTALVLGMPLYLLEMNSLWWVGFSVGGFLLVLVFLAEYVVVSPGDVNYPTAMVVLTVLSFALYLILAMVLRYSAARLFFLLPMIFIATFFVGSRTLNLRLGGRWEIAWSLGIAFVGVQLAAGLHYLPISPVYYGVTLLAVLYALTSLVVSLLEGLSLRRALTESGIMLFLLVVLGVWFG
jgi:hypothetical protein